MGLTPEEVAARLIALERELLRLLATVREIRQDLGSK